MVRILLALFRGGENKTRLADAGLSIDEHEPALAGLDVIPAPLQQRQLFLAADQFCGLRMQGFEAACGGGFSQKFPKLDRIGARFQVEEIGMSANEKGANEDMRCLGN